MLPLILFPQQLQRDVLGLAQLTMNPFRIGLRSFRCFLLLGLRIEHGFENRLIDMLNLFPRKAGLFGFRHQTADRTVRNFTASRNLTYTQSLVQS